ncbi:MAG: type I pantothenate kinase [Bifidobacteriaceae bacterium]|nr:type I pantothenate kinase [Bifidobacteriaceae bacterium]
MPEASPNSPYLTFDRDTWSQLAASTPLPFGEADIARIRSLGDVISLDEVQQIYRPLSGLLNLHAHASAYLHDVRGMFLGDATARTPYVIGIAGSVAVGKSTVARLLVELLARWPDTPRVELLTTDGFLWPNAELERRGLMDRKGFPESYDRVSLLRCLAQVKSGEPLVEAPRYSHLRYDIVPGEKTIIRQPDILVVEGLNVLQAARTAGGEATELVVSDFFDFSIYLDAAEPDVRQWYLDRFRTLRATAFQRPESYFHRYASMPEADALAYADQVWQTINRPNLEQNIEPTSLRASLVLTKGADHRVTQVRLRRV